MGSARSVMEVSGGPMGLITEDQLLNEIAYYRARLADIEKAPEQSRHREGLERVSSRLKECQHQLAALRSKRANHRF